MIPLVTFSQSGEKNVVFKSCKSVSLCESFRVFFLISLPFRNQEGAEAAFRYTFNPLFQPVLSFSYCIFTASRLYYLSFCIIIYQCYHYFGIVEFNKAKVVLSPSESMTGSFF